MPELKLAKPQHLPNKCSTNAEWLQQILKSFLRIFVNFNIFVVEVSTKSAKLTTHIREYAVIGILLFNKV